VRPEVRRRWIWGKGVFLDTSGTTFVVQASDILPQDFLGRYWALAEVRGYRAATTALAQAAILQSIRAGDGEMLFPMGSSGEGLGIEAQSGILPLWLPIPKLWSGSLDVAAVSDNGASLTFRFMFSFVELTRQEWEHCGGPGEMPV
jgi:hypothetical protein